jgi:hypothetical protein
MKYVLTKKGWAFKTIKDENKKEQLFSSAKHSKAVQEKYWWLWPILTAIVGYLAGWLLPIKLPERNQEHKQPSQVEARKPVDTTGH